MRDRANGVKPRMHCMRGLRLALWRQIVSRQHAADVAQVDKRVCVYGRVFREAWPRVADPDPQSAQFDPLHHHHTRRVLSAPSPDLSKTVQPLSVAARLRLL
jgi:hypothetical protein